MQLIPPHPGSPSSSLQCREIFRLCFSCTAVREAAPLAIIFLGLDFLAFSCSAPLPPHPPPSPPSIPPSSVTPPHYSRSICTTNLHPLLDPKPPPPLRLSLPQINPASRYVPTSIISSLFTLTSSQSPRSSIATLDSPERRSLENLRPPAFPQNPPPRHKPVSCRTSLGTCILIL